MSYSVVTYLYMYVIFSGLIALVGEDDNFSAIGYS